MKHGLLHLKRLKKVLQTLMKRKPKKKEITSYLNSNYSISQKDRC